MRYDLYTNSTLRIIIYEWKQVERKWLNTIDPSSNYGIHPIGFSWFNYGRNNISSSESFNERLFKKITFPA